MGFNPTAKLLEDNSPLTDSSRTEVDTTYQESSLQEKIEIAKEIFMAATSNIFSCIGVIFKDVISLFFIGHLNDPLKFAAAGFGFTWMNSFGSAVINGFAGGFATYAAQAFGARNFRKLGLLYQKTLVVMAALGVLVGFILWFTKQELIFFGFDEALASEVGTFIRYLMVDLVFVMLFETTKCYLMAQNIFQVPAWISLFTTTVHIFWCYLFVNLMGLELVGMAIARTLTDATSTALIFLYIRLKNPNPESWFPWTKECLQDLVAYSKTIGTQGAALYFEWIAFEITTLIIGYLGNVNEIAAHSAVLNYIFANGCFSVGLSFSTSVFVGNAAGEGRLNKAKKYAYIGLILNVTLVFLLEIILLLFKNGIASFYTSEENVKELIGELLIFYFIGMYGDLISNGLAATLRNLGQEKFLLKGYLFAYYGIGTTLSIILSLWLDFGYKGVWLSLVLGFAAMLTLTVLQFKNLNWEYEVKKISQEMKHKHDLDEVKCEIEMNVR